MATAIGHAYGATATPQGQIKALMESGHRLLQQGDFEAALQEYEKIIAIDPTNAEALYRAATIYLRMNQPSKAIDYLERSVASAPKNIRLRMILAQTYERAQIYDKALAEYRKVLELEPSGEVAKEAHKRETIILGKQYGQQGQFELALQQFSAVLKDYPNDVPTLIDKGLTLIFMNRFDEAQTVMEQAEAVEPENSLIHRYLGEIAEKQGRLEESAQEYQRAIQLTPPGSPAIQALQTKLALVLGSQYLNQGKSSEARQEYEKVLAADPKNYEARFKLAKVYHDLGDLPRSEEMLKSLLEDNPSDLTIKLRLGTLYLEQGNLDDAGKQLNEVIAKGGDSQEAKQAGQLLANVRSTAEKVSPQALPNDSRIALYRSLVQSNPDDQAAWLDLGQLYARLGRQQEAVDALEKAVQLKPDDARAQALLGGVYDDMGKFDQAQEVLDKALELESEPEQKKKLAERIAMVLAKKAYNAGELEVADKEFSQILALNPDNFVAHFFLGLIDARNGKTDEAERQYKEVLRIVPGHALARLNLAAIHEQNGHEEDAVDEYKAVMISGVPGLADTARSRLEQLMKRIGGLSLSGGYSLNYDSNSNLSPTAPAAELRSDTSGSITYQHKIRGRRLYLGMRLSPTYSIYHQEQFDFLSTELSPFANGVWRDLNWSASYVFDQTDGVLVEQHYNRGSGFNADVLKRFKMRSLLPFLINSEQGSVQSAWRINGTYRIFRSETAPIFDADTYSIGALLSQTGESGWTWTGLYSFTDNNNAEAVGNDFAYTSHGINLQLSKSLSPKLSLNGGYGFIYSSYSNPDSVTRFTKTRTNQTHAAFVGLSYTLNDNLRFYGSFLYQRNISNLPTGFILSTQDVGTAVGIQSPSLGSYRKYGITMGLAMSF
jgi:tetratricopeptide (TPR) repeat protein